VENNAIGKCSIPRHILVDYIKSLGSSTTDESFITPGMAFKAVDFVHLLKYRTGVNDNVSD
jgi:hypothetical protein